MGYLNTSNLHAILQSHSSRCLVNTISISKSKHKTWFIKNHTKQHAQIYPDRISCNLEVKLLFLYQSKCCETTSITTMCVLEFIKTTPSILIHKIWFNTDFSCCKHQICHNDSFIICSYKIIKYMQLVFISFGYFYTNTIHIKIRY